MNHGQQVATLRIALFSWQRCRRHCLDDDACKSIRAYFDRNSAMPGVPVTVVGNETETVFSNEIGIGRVNKSSRRAAGFHWARTGWQPADAAVLRRGREEESERIAVDIPAGHLTGHGNADRRFKLEIVDLGRIDVCEQDIAWTRATATARSEIQRGDKKTKAGKSAAGPE